MQHTKVDIVIHGGRVVSSTFADLASVAIKGSQIAVVGPEALMTAADRL